MRSLRRSAMGEIFGGMTPAVRWLIVGTVGIWILQILPIRALDAVWGALALRPYLVLGGWIWQLVTYQFLHSPAAVGHVLFNMFMLWQFGRELERMWGTWRFVAYYLACGAAGGLLHVVMSLALGNAAVPVVGASAAVLGLLTGWAVYWPHRNILFFFIIPMEIRFAVLITAGLALAFAWNRDSGVANFAHLGGMGFGWLWLRHGWRLGRIGSLPGSVSRRLSDWKRARKRSRMKVLDGEREWEKWLSGNDPDDGAPRH